ncbi:hypothetical protein TOT_030000815 [Theileria orientalis strain Shintoku]|uniref:Uncharacterized protein n=1 Tax=Theileria orientalis strain Shintoku TaxID=869250 RepID=J4CDQ5_THEOR|nr:LOW QUALITY PROTEIN: hypothetical protein TOT_030000815 [Theileria orientalis strain Shintoku]BAM41552.1 hypothetical protein TOT_030000815 [Theileria orientalis strain Shintoku]|eukprot:XP_009691853.1 LOW QUALITY PROTEIN: hypothetical protein TOT_030000815 [Theileria orientalis strain Shintoku]
MRYYRNSKFRVFIASISCHNKMGLGQSYLYIYLESKDDKYGESIDANNRYEVTSTKGILTECDSFEVVTHKIDVRKPNDMIYDIYIYDSKRIATKASYIFAYCSPTVKSHVVKEVKVYYSVLAPHKPLAITFVREKEDTHHCDIDKLRKVGWDWAKNITEHASSNLVELLKQQYKNFAWDRTIEFDQGNKPTSQVIVFPRAIDGIHYRLVFIPNQGHPVLNRSCLFNFNTEHKSGTGDSFVQNGCQSSSSGDKNKLDSYFLEKVKSKLYFNGIIVYFARKEEKNKVSLDEKHDDNMALLVEFINSCETIGIKRKDKDGCLWAEEKVVYTDQQSRVNALKKIKEEAESYNCNTVIIEHKSNYTCGTTVTTETKTSYNKYTHQFTVEKELNILFERKTITIDSFSPSSIQTKKVEVFYLKYKTKDKGEQDDGKPFLIAIYKNGEDKPAKVFHFTLKEDFKEWKELEAGKFKDKFTRIDNETKCTTELHYLKILVYQILTTDVSQPPPEPPTPTDPVRPGVDPEIPPPLPGPDWWLIIGCSVGGFLLLVALVVGYAIYWYNTTIRLLT